MLRRVEAAPTTPATPLAHLQTPAATLADLADPTLTLSSTSPAALLQYVASHPRNGVHRK